MENFEQLIKEMRNSKAKEMLSIIGVPEIYNLKNLKVFQKRVTKLIKSNEIPFEVSIALSGFVLGETIVKNIEGAHWIENDYSDIFRVPIALPINYVTTSSESYSLQVYPFDRAMKFTNYPEVYDFVEYYQMIEKMKKNNIDLFNQPNGKWVNHGDIQSRTYYF